MWGVLQMNSTKLPKIILFDLDGVILDTESIYLELMVEYNKNVNMPITREFYINNFLGRTKRGGSSSPRQWVPSQPLQCTSASVCARGW